MTPFEMSWGTATPELSNTERGIALHVINHRLESETDLGRNILFLRGRLAWFASELPAGWVQWVRFDDRGQSIPAGIRDRLRSALQQAASFTFESER